MTMRFITCLISVLVSLLVTWIPWSSGYPSSLDASQSQTGKKTSEAPGSNCSAGVSADLPKVFLSGYAFLGNNLKVVYCAVCG